MMCDLKCTSNSSRQPRWEFLTLHAVYRFPTWGNSTQISVGCWTICPHMNTPWKFNSSPLKMDGWKMSFLLGFPIFRGYVKLRGGIWTWVALLKNRFCKTDTSSHHHLTPLVQPIYPSWWFQPIWKICSSNCIISPSIVAKNKKIFENHHSVTPYLIIYLQ